MAQHQTQHLQAAHQHLALHQQEDSVHPVRLIHRHQQALIAVQDLERQRILSVDQTTWDQSAQAT